MVLLKYSAYSWFRVLVPSQKILNLRTTFVLGVSDLVTRLKSKKRLLVPLHSLRLPLPIMMSTESRRRHALCALHFHSDLKKGKIVQFNTYFIWYNIHNIL